jgi:quercetin dioxygenase-like cupin family protein
MPCGDAVRRVVTGFDDEGASVVVEDGGVTMTHVVDGAAVFHEVWGAEGDPPPLAPPTDGSVARVIDFPPGFASPMHRTDTVDYGVVLEGEVVLVMGGGDERVLAPGDIVVQHGTDHLWANRRDTPARMVFVLIA